MSRGKLVLLVLARLWSGIFVMALFFFLAAGKWDYWQAWMFMGTLFIPMFALLFYLLKNDPALLERRIRMREERERQKLVIQAASVVLSLAFILPGFDIRYGWSHVPAWASIAACLFSFLGYMLFFRVMQVNSYASRVVEITEGQEVIDTDVYGIVRHPMYVAVIIMCVASPIALGSYWAVIAGLMVIPVLVARINDEEAALENGLPGYVEYKQKVKYRLLPFVW